jgi:hypothetical protein
MVKVLVRYSLFLSILILAACNLPAKQRSVSAPTGTPKPTLSSLTNGPVIPTDPESTSTPITAEVDVATLFPTDKASTTVVASTPIPTDTPVGPPCNRAVPGSPIDVTISDGTVLMPQQVFSKTWRLINAGSCAWSRDYAVVWFSGPVMAQSKVQNFRNPVRPGEIIEITVDMVAPETAGSYQSNWKLRDGNGEMFGLGPTGDSPFWVKIEVYAPQYTPTPTSEPTVTATAVVYNRGSIGLSIKDQVDLDTGTTDSPAGSDFNFQEDVEGHPVFAPEKGVEIAYFGNALPQLDSCTALTVKKDAIRLAEVKEGSYFCYITSQGLPGFLSFGLQDLPKKEILVNFTTWSKP